MTENILDKIIRPEHRNKLNDWVQYTQEREILGLETIDQIVRSKGNKHVHVRLPQEKVMYETHQSLMHRKNKLS
jgi:Na+-transporting NADH:ubiquinone oxidoreductase subunit NqrF